MELKENIPFEDLLNALKDEDSSFSPKYLYRLANISGEELDKLRALWDQISLQRRRSLLEDLEQLEDSNYMYSFESLYRLALNDIEPILRKIGIRALWDYEDITLIPTFLDLLDNDSHPKVRAQAAAGLGRFIYMGAMEEISAEKMTNLEEKLLGVMASDSEETIRQKALESLGFSSRESVHDLIEESYLYGDDQWIISSLVAMGRTANRAWEPRILEKLDDSNLHIRVEAIRATGEIILEEAVPALLNILETEDSDFRLGAAWALSEIGGEGILEGLELLLEESDSDEEEEFVESAIENLRLTEEINELSLMDFNEDELEDLIGPFSDEESQV